MLIVVNPYSAGGTALKKWERVFRKLPNDADIFSLNGSTNLHKKLKESISQGNYEFVAAGGDGTVNLLLNKFISAAPDKIEEFKLGAIGLGSSNDFHKPFNHFSFINDIPAKINFEKAEKRDAAFICYKKDGLIVRKYYLINASIGITADANNYFNHPDRVLEFFKRINTNLAIIYSALKTIFVYKNFQVHIRSDEAGEISCKLTNIGIIKNPNFSGNLSYGGFPNYDNGKLDIHLCFDMNKRNLFHLLLALSKGKFNKIKKTKSWSTKEITISASKPFNVELDGEVIKADYVKFGVLPKYVKVCND